MKLSNMDIQINNCTNIASAINGTGKSTVAKAIEYAAVHDENGKSFNIVCLYRYC